MPANELEAEERRARERLEELERQIADLERDIARQNAAQADGAATIARLKGEGEELSPQRRRRRSGEGGRGSAPRRRRGGARRGRGRARRAAGASLRPQRPQSRARSQRCARRTSAPRASPTSAAASSATSPRSRPPRRARRPRILPPRSPPPRRRCAAPTSARPKPATSLAGAREAEARGRGPANDTERAAQRLETEVRTLAKLFASGTDDMWPKVLDFIAVAKGYETALGAALGEDLEGSSTTSAPVHWALSGDGADDPALPEGVRPLSDFVQGPDALKRRLAQIGIVARGRRRRPAGAAQARPAARVARGRSVALGRLHGGGRRALRGGAPARREEPPRRPRARFSRGPRRRRPRARRSRERASGGARRSVGRKRRARGRTQARGALSILPASA